MSKIELIIFISSRIEEFESDRLILKDELKKINMKPIIFEDYGAQDIPVEEANIEDVRKCHIFIGIYGLKYSGPTYKEFKEAIESNKSCLFYIKKHSNGEKLDSKMKDFISEIKAQNKTYKYFDNVINLKTTVIEDVISEISRGFIRDKYEFSDAIKNYIDKIIETIDDYSQFQNFVKKFDLKTNIAQINKIDSKLRIVIDKGLNDGLFENVEFYIKKGAELKSRIIVESLQEKMSICTPRDKLPKNFQKEYSKFSLEIINLSRKDFIEKMIWRKLK